MNRRDNILNGATTAFIDSTYKSSAAYLMMVRTKLY